MKNSIHTFVILAYKESEYLEDCIKSVLNQSVKSNVLIATTTNNNYIKNLAKKYKISVEIGKHTNIGGDFDYALSCSKTPLVTIAHQDDIYDFNYAKEVISKYKLYPKSLIIFTDYYEIRNNKKFFKNINLKIKRILLFPLQVTHFKNKKFIKRSALRFGNAICCPAVTFVKSNISSAVFKSDFQCNVDWFAWEKLSKLSGEFIFIKKVLVGHRIDVSTTTTNIINQGIRTNEDYIMFRKFWPPFIAKILNAFYKNSEKSNKV